MEHGLDAKMKVLVNKIKRTRQMTYEDSQMMRDAIRNSVQRVYVVGADYAANFLQKEFIMTTDDIQIIKSLSNEFADRMQWRINTYVIGRDEETKPISTDFVTSTFAGYVAPRSLSVAIREKARQILQATSLLPTTRFASTIIPQNASAPSAEAAAPRPKPSTDYYIEYDQYKDPEEGLPPVVLKWVTANDDRVCPICSDLDGSVFEVDDPDIPEPDSDTHPNCRCMLRLAELP